MERLFHAKVTDQDDSVVLIGEFGAAFTIDLEEKDGIDGFNVFSTCTDGLPEREAIALIRGSMRFFLRTYPDEMMKIISGLSSCSSVFLENYLEEGNF